MHYSHTVSTLYLRFISFLYRDLTHWVKGGFNACLITYGEEGAGKTAALFGFDNTNNYSHNQSDTSSNSSGRVLYDRDSKGTRPGIALSVLKEVFADSQQYDSNDRPNCGTNSSDNGEGKITVALSAWSLCGHQIIE